MIAPLLAAVRDNPKTAASAIGALVIFGGYVARTEEAVQKVPELEKAVIGIEKILAEQKGREEGKKEGERKMLEKLCAADKLPPEECEGLR
jgi:hypothetical protein